MLREVGGGHRIAQPGRQGEDPRIGGVGRCLRFWTHPAIVGIRDPERKAAPQADRGTMTEFSDQYWTSRDGLKLHFRDYAGRLNQRLAATVETVIFIAAGQPLVLKPAPALPPLLTKGA